MPRKTTKRTKHAPAEKRFSIKLDRELEARLSLAVDKLDTDRSKLTRRALREILDRLAV